jgi:hypothetical protein
MVSPRSKKFGHLGEVIILLSEPETNSSDNEISCPDDTVDVFELSFAWSILAEKHMSFSSRMSKRAERLSNCPNNRKIGSIEAAKPNSWIGNAKPRWMMGCQCFARNSIMRWIWHHRVSEKVGHRALSTLRLSFVGKEFPTCRT